MITRTYDNYNTDSRNYATVASYTYADTTSTAAIAEKYEYGER